MKFNDAKELERILDLYFAACDAKTSWYVTKEGDRIEIPDPEPYTITGMCLALDCDRKTLLNYTNDDTRDPEILHTIHKAKLRCEHYAEKSLWKPKIASGVIFNLTNNYGWKDKQSVELGGDGERPVEFNDIGRGARVAAILDAARARRSRQPDIGSERVGSTSGETEGSD